VCRQANQTKSHFSLEMKLSEPIQLILILSLVALSTAAPHANYLFKDAVKPAAINDWQKLYLSRVDKSFDSMDLTFVLTESDELTLQLEHKLYELAHPNSINYAQWLSYEELNELTSINETNVANVVDWIISGGGKNLRNSPTYSFITASFTVKQAETLLNTEYNYYINKHKSNEGGVKEMVLRCESYGLPAHIHHLIDIVGPTVRFPSKFGPIKSDSFSEELNFELPSVGNKTDPCILGVTPNCLRAIYNVSDYTAAANTNSTVAANGFLEQYIDFTDINEFWKLYDPKRIGPNVTILGPNQPGILNSGTEALLDIEFMSSLAAGVPTTFWYTAGRQPKNNQNEPFLVWLQSLASTKHAPWVISTSYGDNENTVDFKYAQRVSTEFMKAGLRGLTLLFSSGDGGVSGGQPSDCTVFIPTFPASSPWITGVGGSTWWPEKAASLSAGGFSNYFPRPKYQNSAVHDYFHKYGSQFPNSSWYNTSASRAFPDIAAQAQGFIIVQMGLSMPVAGTSCSSPTVAGIIALLNDARFQAGKTSLGFLNPLIYSHPSAFNDITSGSNPGCESWGFFAAKGWDPITGWGSPDFLRLKKLVLSLP
jgi:tripeptidyl-peptidase-1